MLFAEKKKNHIINQIKIFKIEITQLHEYLEIGNYKRSLS